MLFILFLTCFIEKTECQRERLDSLLNVEKQYIKEDSTRVLLLIEVMKEYRKLKLTKERFRYAEIATALGEKINFIRLLPAIYNVKGLYYEGLSDFEKSIANYERAIAISEQLGDKENAAGYMLNFGTVYHTLADYPTALTLYQKAANYYINAGNADDAANCYINMGGVYSEFPGQTEKSIEFTTKALDIFLKMGENGRRGVAEAYLSLIYVYGKASDAELQHLRMNPGRRYEICKQYVDKANAIAVETDDSSLKAEVSNTIGGLEEKELNYPEALKNYYLSLAIFQKLDNRKYANTALLDIGRIYQKQKDYQQSLLFLRKALAGARQMNVLDQQKDALFNISDIYEKQHQYDSAYLYYKKYIVMHDSIFNNEKQKEITRKQLQFEFGVKEREYKLIQQISANRIKEQGDSVIRQKQELSLQDKQLELVKREKEIEKLNYLKKQSELETDRKLQASLLNQKELEKKLATSQRDKMINQQQLQIRFDKKLNLFLAGILLILGITGFFVYKAKQKTSRLNVLVSAQKTELEELGNVKDKIFSIVSHDMRTPVNNLVSFSALLEEGGIDQEKLLKYLEQIKGTLDHTSTMMENLLNWSASQMQGFRPVIGSLSLNQVVTDVIKGMEPVLQKKRITLENTSGNTVLVNADKNMVELVIRNILTNAVKFSERNGKIEISIESAENNQVVLSVKDNGVGLNSDQVRKINALSVQTLESTPGTDKEKGTGLGLMLCKHFAHLMKGSISVESGKTAGSIFSLTLPQA